jgi:Tol biopolymer transport system component
LFTTYDIEQAQRRHKVWQIAVEGGGPKEIPLRIERLGYAGRVSFHPDGKRIAFIADNSKSAIWVMDNFLPATQTKKTTASRR